MIAQMIPNNKDNLLAERNVSIRDYVLNPCNKPKDEVPLWLFVSLHKDAPRRRNMLNYDAIHAIIIEWDNKVSISMTIEQFEVKYKHLAYALHTTSSHTTARPKFRAILPLDMKYPYSMFHDRFVKEAMLEYFPGIDASCFSNFQKIPALPANPSEYQYRINQGAKFSYCLIKNKVEAKVNAEKEKNAERARLRALRPKDMSFNYDAYKQAALINITAEFAGCGRCKSGHRYSDLCSYAGKLINAKYPDATYIFDDAEVESIILHEYSDNNIKKMLNAFLRNRK